MKLDRSQASVSSFGGLRATSPHGAVEWSAWVRPRSSRLRWRFDPAARPRVRDAGIATLAVSVTLASLTAGATVNPDNPHREDANCQLCHTTAEISFAEKPVAARSSVAPDLDAVCERCHGDEGPSHKTGV